MEFIPIEVDESAVTTENVVTEEIPKKEVQKDYTWLVVLGVVLVVSAIGIWIYKKRQSKKVDI